MSKSRVKKTNYVLASDIFVNEKLTRIKIICRTIEKERKVFGFNGLKFQREEIWSAKCDFRLYIQRNLNGYFLHDSTLHLRITFILL